MDQDYSMVIAAGMLNANAGTIGYAIKVLEDDEKRLVAEGATAAEINTNRKVRGALSKKRALVRQKGTTSTESDQERFDKLKKLIP